MQKRIERLEKVIQPTKQRVEIYWDDGTFIGSYEIASKPHKVDK